MQLVFWQKFCLCKKNDRYEVWSDASQNDHKSKGYPSKTSEAAFTMQGG